MAKKTLVFNEVARKGLEAGVNKLADVVKKHGCSASKRSCI